VRLGLEEHARLDSPLHHWEPRCKLVGLMVLIFAFSSVQDVCLLPAMLAVSSALYLVSGLPVSYLLARLRNAGFFLLAVVILLPFLSGPTIILRIGPLSLRQEGCLDLLLVVGRFVSILTTGVVLFGTAPPLTTIKAMRALGLPPVLADMMLFSYRYLHEISDDLETMERAMELRGFRARHLGTHTLVVLASLAGSLLVRSYEQSERVYKTMILRGYGRSRHRHDEFPTRPRDVNVLVGALLVAAAFVCAQILCGGNGG